MTQSRKRKKKDLYSRICGFTLTFQSILDSCELKGDKQQGLASAVSNFDQIKKAHCELPNVHWESQGHILRGNVRGA